VMEIQAYHNLISKEKFELYLGVGYLLQHQMFYINSDQHNKLNSRYTINPQKYGVNIKIGTNLFERTQSFVKLKINKINYFAEADWNLMQGVHHPISFSHKSPGYNFRISLNSKINI